MLGAGGILMISGGTAAIPRTDYSYAAETAAGTEEEGAASELESETMQELSAVEENRRETEENTEGQLQEIALGETGRFETEAPATESEVTEEFETEVSEAETEESEDNETEVPATEAEVTEEFETEVS